MSDVRNFTLVCGERRWRRLPIRELRWLDDRRPCATTPVRPVSTRGRKFPATPPSDGDVHAILDELFDPAAHATAKWATKWGPIRLRNRALIALLRGSGLRVHEALLLAPPDLDFERCMVVVQRGKGGKRRISGIDRPTLAEVNVWLHVRSLLGLGVEEPIFCVLEGPTRGGLLSQAYVRVKLHEAARTVGVMHRVAPHQLRHALAVGLARDGVPVPLISRQLGHSNVATTATYLSGIAPEEVLEVMSGRTW